MPTIAENLQRLVDAKTAIANAITVKGGTVAQGDGLSDFATDIGTIPTGVDTSSDTVTAGTLAEGYTAHDATGQQITGTMQGGLEMNVKFTAGNKTIPEYMFYNNHGSGSTNSGYPIEEVVIGDGVTSIGRSAFSRCTSLTSITIPDNVTSIGDFAFNNCTSLTNITIPDNVTSIGSSAFSGCTGLTSITIPDNVTSIGSSAFNNCTSLTNITIPDGVTSIGSLTFNNCSGLTNVTIGNGVTSIDRYAFQGCSNLTTITLDKPQDSVSGAPWGATNATVVWTG